MRSYGRYAVVLAVLLAGAVLNAEDKKDKDALTGTWDKSGAQLKLEFVDADVLKIYPHGGKEIVIVCKYVREKDKPLKAEVTEFEGKDDLKQKIQNVIPMGLKFSFKWQVNNDAATLEEVQGDKTETFQSHLEGKYEKKN